ncbi:MAG TPA: HAD family hydrolase [Acidothermaceae bacterium]
MYQAVLLDVFGTLVQDDGEGFNEIAALIAHQAGADPGDVAAEWSACLTALADAAHGSGFRTLADLNLGSLIETAGHFGLRASDAREMWRAHTESSRPGLLFDDSLAFLAAVQVPICLVSDADRDALEVVLAHHGVAVDLVVTSEDARAYKPRPEPFQLALQRLELAAADVIHVGDSPERDIGGANDQGIDTAFVSRDGRALPPNVVATHTVEDLTALVALLG